MKRIDHLPPAEQAHFEQCPQCGCFFDCRDLTDVFAHEHYLPPLPPICGGRGHKVPPNDSFTAKLGKMMEN